MTCKLNHLYNILISLLITAAVFPLFTQVTNAITPESGTFNTRDGSECTWFDLHVNKDKVALATACMCKDQEGKPQSYGCQYTGPVHSCEKYETQSREVLLGLVKQLEALNSSCQLPHLVTPDCSQMILEREMLHQPKSPCVYGAPVQPQEKKHKEL